MPCSLIHCYQHFGGRLFLQNTTSPIPKAKFFLQHCVVRFQVKGKDMPLRKFGIDAVQISNACWCHVASHRDNWGRHQLIKDVSLALGFLACFRLLHRGKEILALGFSPGLYPSRWIFREIPKGNGIKGRGCQTWKLPSVRYTALLWILVCSASGQWLRSAGAANFPKLRWSPWVESFM